METWSNIPFIKKELNLKVTLSGGQCFRWKETNREEWTGVIGCYVWRLRWSPTDFAKLEFKVWSDTGINHSVAELKSQLMKYLRHDMRLESLYKQWRKNDPHFRMTVSKSHFKGIRMLNQDPVENIFSFICSSNNNISRISSMVEKMCVSYGEKICTLDDQDYYSFPRLEVLARPEVESKLRDQGFGYRAPFVQQTASKILQQGGQEWLQNLTSLEYKEAKQQLMNLPGIGAKVADCICLMSLGHLQAVPVDTHVYQIAVKHYVPHLAGRKSLTTKVYDEISGHFRKLYGPLAGWAHTVLFVADLKSFQENKYEDGQPKKKKRRR